MWTELFFACIPSWYISVTSECLMFLILHENLFPNVILICHPLYKEKHMLAIRGAVWMQLPGNPSSYAILRNPIFIIYLKRCKNAEHWDDLQSLRKVAEYYVWPSLLDALSRRTPSSPGAALAKGSGIWAWGGEAKLCLGTLHSPFLQMINFYFSRLHFAMYSLLSLILMLKVGLGCRGKILGLGDRKPGSSLNWELGWAIRWWGGILIPRGISSDICNMESWTRSVNL